MTGIVLKKCLSVFDEEKRFAPTYDEEQTLTVPCDHVFLSIGQSVQWGGLLADTKVELSRGQTAAADGLTYQTAEPDIFVGGDVYTGPKFAIDAIAAGKEGAISIHRFVQPHSSLTIGRNRRPVHPAGQGEYPRRELRQFQPPDSGQGSFHRSQEVLPRRGADLYRGTG